MSATATPAPTAAVRYGQEFASFYDRLFPGGATAEATVARLAELRLRRRLAGARTGRRHRQYAPSRSPSAPVRSSASTARPTCSPGSGRPGRRTWTAVEADIVGFDDGGLRVRARVLHLRDALDGARAGRAARRPRRLRPRRCPRARRS